MGRSLSAGLRAIAIALVVACVAVALDYQDTLRRWNDFYFDLLVLKDQQPPPQDVLLIEIDQRSLDALGRWPWPRDIHAQLVTQLTRQGARVVAFDVLFAEQDVANQDGDQLLADAVANHGRVVLPVAPEATESNGYLIETLPFPGLAGASAGLGHVDIAPSPDGRARLAFLRAGIGAPRWPHLALAVLDAAAGDVANERLSRVPAATGPPGNRLAWVRDGLVRFPTIGPPGHFQRASYVDVLRSGFPDEAIQNRFVFIGAAAAGLGDTTPSRISAQGEYMSGVEIIANLFEAARRNRFYLPLDTTAQLGATFLSVLIGCLLGGWLFRQQRRRLSVLITCIPLLGSAVLLAGRLWFDPMPAFLMLAFAYVAMLAGNVRGLDRLLRRERHVAKKTLQMLAEAVLTVDRQGRISYLNPAAERLTGWQLSEAVGRPMEEVFQANTEDSEHPFRLPEMKPDSDDSPPYWVMTRHDGSRRVVRVSYGYSRDAENPEANDVVVTFSDVTTERQLTEKLQHQASHDALTEMPNRTLLNDRLQQAIARAKRHGHAIAVLFTDLDDFKRINDTLGHASGDSLLQIVAHRLQVNVRAEDTVARVGGDEFVILIEQLSDTGTALTTARKLVEAIRQPLEINGHELSITTSVGLSCYPQDGTEIDDLLRNADLAMYSAKSHGGNTVKIFQPELKQNALERFTLDNDLQRALERQEFRLFYQPLFDLQTERIIGAEALLRWQHPQRGLLTPDVLIAAAERSRQIIPIGEWVLRTACTQLRAWQTRHDLPLRIAVNLSPRQLEVADFPATVAAIVSESQIKPTCLDLEITEDVLMTDAHGERETLRQLAGLGIGLTIDDFGTGYSWFSYLKHLPVTRLKIDRSFIYELASQKDDAAIVKAIVAMAKSLRLSTTAEGVETQAQSKLLRQIGCEFCQGFFYAGPLNAEDFEQLLQRRAKPVNEVIRSIDS